MDLTESIAPKSDQMDAVDLIAGARTFTITEVRKGPSAEQPFSFVLAEFPRPYRPNKTMRRIIVKAWNSDADYYAGKRFTLYHEPSVRWAGEEVGGIRISHMSDLPGNKPLKISLLVSNKKIETFTIQPLANAPTPQQPTDRTAAAITAFAALGITEDMLTEHIGTPRAQWDVTALLDLYKRVKAGELTAADFAPAVTVNTETGEIVDEPDDFDVRS